MAISQRRETVIDPRFPVPQGVVDVRQQVNEELPAEDYYDEESLAEEGPDIDEAPMSIAMPPATFEVLEQRVRISPDGRSVVDVTLLFPDMEGIANVDVRVTKV